MNRAIKFLTFIFLSTIFSRVEGHYRLLDKDNGIADMVVFSYDRPLQLFSLLETVSKYVTGLKTVNVICRYSSPVFKKGYEEVKNRYFPEAILHYEDEGAHTDFKFLTLTSIFDTSTSYVLFSMDDMLATDYIDLRDCAKAVEKHKAYGFYLRLGRNINSYGFGKTKKRQRIPRGKQFGDIFKWQFKDGMKSWGYANNMDMIFFPKKHLTAFRTISYRNPNTFEMTWCKQVNPNRYGLCYRHSKVVNIPINRVQDDCLNATMNLYSTKDLLDVFNKGYKIDINPFHKIAIDAPHIFHDVTFVKR